MGHSQGNWEVTVDLPVDPDKDSNMYLDKQIPLGYEYSMVLGPHRSTRNATRRANRESFLA